MAPFLAKVKSRLSGGGSSHESKLIKLITKQKWNDVLVMLQEQGEAALANKGTASVHVTYSGNEYRNGNVLHIMCMFHPPHKVIHRVASMSPLLAIQVNALRQTPLHVAAAYGASHRVISSLLKHGGTSPASMQDVKGRTPLHLHLKYCTPDTCNCDPGEDNASGNATQNGYSSVNGVKRTSQKSKPVASRLVAGPNVKVLRVLSETAPQSIAMEDKEGLTPMMIASAAEEQASQKSESRIVSALQRTADGARRRSSLGSNNLSSSSRSLFKGVRRSTILQRSNSNHSGNYSNQSGNGGEDSASNMSNGKNSDDGTHASGGTNSKRNSLLTRRTSGASSHNKMGKQGNSCALNTTNTSQMSYSSMTISSEQDEHQHHSQHSTHQ